MRRPSHGGQLGSAVEKTQKSAFGLSIPRVVAMLEPK
jgi:hypothetical protein